MVKRDLLRGYAAVVTGLLADVVTAALLGGYTEYDIIVIAFVCTLVFCLTGAGFMALTEQRTSVRIRAGGTGDKPQKRKKKSWQRIGKHLPGFIRITLMRHAWRAKQREKRRKPSGPQIYTLKGDIIRVPVAGDPDMVEYVPVWTAMKEG